MTIITKTPQDYAAELVTHLEQRERANKNKFWTLKDLAPEWAVSLIRAAHDNAQELPNDWRYRFIQEAALMLAEAKDWDDLEAPEGDIYHHELIEWLAEFPHADWYCDEAAKAWLVPDFTKPDEFEETSIYDRLSLGQAYAKDETMEAVKDFILGLCEVVEPAEKAESAA